MKTAVLIDKKGFRNSFDIIKKTEEINIPVFDISPGLNSAVVTGQMKFKFFEELPNDVLIYREI